MKGARFKKLLILARHIDAQVVSCPKAAPGKLSAVHHQLWFYKEVMYTSDLISQ